MIILSRIKLYIPFLLLVVFIPHCSQNIEEPKFNNINDPSAAFDENPPSLHLTVQPDSGIAGETEFIFDVSGSKETEMPDAKLKYLWDFNDDGNWDKPQDQDERRIHFFQRGGGNRSVYLRIEGARKLYRDTVVTVFVNSRPHIQVSWKRDDHNNNLFYFDASMSVDYEDLKDLDYRWDFNNDGSWEISWSENTTTQFKFSEDEWAVNLEVRDSENLVSQRILPHHRSEKEKIVFRTYDNDKSDLYLVDAATKQIIKLTDSPDIKKRNPRLSPDKNSILFTQTINNIYRPFIMDRSGVIINELDIFAGTNVVTHDWSPDGQEILFTDFFKLYRYHIFDKKISQIIDVQGSIISACWSPTGEWISYSTVSEIHLIKADGSLNHKVSNIDHLYNTHRMAFSPDGNEFAFQAMDRPHSSFAGIYRINIGGFGLEQLTGSDRSSKGSPAWSPSGSKIMYIRDDFREPPDIYLMDSDGGNPELYLRLDNSPLELHWR